MAAGCCSCNAWGNARRKFAHDVEAEIGGAEDATVRKRSLDVLGDLDKVFERVAELFEIRFDVSQNSAPLRRGIAGGAAAAEP